MGNPNSILSARKFPGTYVRRLSCCPEDYLEVTRTAPHQRSERDYFILSFVSSAAYAPLGRRRERPEQSSPILEIFFPGHPRCVQLRPKAVTSSSKTRMWCLGLCTALLLTPSLASPQAQQPNPPPSAPEPKIKFAQTPYQPITGRQRVKWVLVSPFEPENLLRGLFSAGLGTASNTPREHGPHWDGFAKSDGKRVTGRSTSEAME